MCKDDSLLFRKLEHTRSSCLIFAKGQVESILLYITVGCLTKPKKRPKYSLFLYYFYLSTFVNLLIKCLNSYDYYFNCTLIGDIRDIREKRMKSELACMLYNFFIYFIYFFYFVFSLHMLCSLALLSCFIFKKKNTFKTILSFYDSFFCTPITIIINTYYITHPGSPTFHFSCSISTKRGHP